MTKDVLVSISGHHIDIMAEPEDQVKALESGQDAIEVVTPASYYCRGGKHYILYDEVMEGMPGTIKNRIKITGTDSVEIVKSGLSSSHMIFEKNRKKSDLLPHALRADAGGGKYKEYGSQCGRRQNKCAG